MLYLLLVGEGPALVTPRGLLVVVFMVVALGLMLMLVVSSLEAAAAAAPSTVAGVAAAAAAAPGEEEKRESEAGMATSDVVMVEAGAGATASASSRPGGVTGPPTPGVGAPGLATEEKACSAALRSAIRREVSANLDLSVACRSRGSRPSEHSEVHVRQGADWSAPINVGGRNRVSRAEPACLPTNIVSVN